MKVDNALPYSERRLQTTAKHVGRAVTDVADAFVAGLTVMQPNTPGLTWLNIGMGVGHAAFGISRLSKAADENITAVQRQKCITQAFGEGLQVAGYAGLAFGLGAWALPILATGAVISNFAYFQ